MDYISNFNSLLGIVNFNHKKGCNRCTVEGEWSYDAHTMIFTKLNAANRTDEIFRAMGYSTHHHRKTPLAEIPNLDMILDFPVGDSMHLIDLGITKRLLNGWRGGTLCNVHSKLSSRQSQQISDYLDSTRAPYEIRSQRRVRGFFELKNWKAIEYRNFLLYLSLVSMKNVLRDYIYEHFILYFCAITIFSSRYHLTRHFKVAEKCISYFLERFKIIYGCQFFTSNLHNLSHLSEDVERFGCLDTFNSYPFESQLFTISRLIRSGNLPLEQVANRIREKEEVYSSITINKRSLKKRTDQPRRTEFHEQYIWYFQMDSDEMFIDCKRDEDSWVLTKNNSIVKTQYIAQDKNGSVFLYGQSVTTLSEYFFLPINSSDLLIFCCELMGMDDSILIDIENIRCKMFKLPPNLAGDQNNDKKTVFIPILKTLL